MSAGRLQLFAYLIFLLIYAAQKYLAADPGSFVPVYVISTAILVVTTGVLPFLAGKFVFGRLIGGGKAFALLALPVPLLVAAAGFATYFYIFIAPQNLGIGVADILPRSLTPGLVQGALLIFGYFKSENA